MKYNVPSKELAIDFNKFSRGENFHSDKNHILICAAPKSGSTFLHKIFTELPNYNNCNLVPGEGARERELCIRKLVMSHRGFDHYASHLHLKFSHVTGDLISQFNLKPIVLVRNIFDSVISTYDYYYSLKEAAESCNFDIRIMGPTAYLPKEIFDWNEEKILHFIVDIAIPWYFNFLMTWQTYPKAYWLCYEDLISNPEKTVLEINNFYHLGLSESDIHLAVQSAQNQPEATKMNKGLVGRGEFLPDFLKEQIYRQASYYNGSDLRLFGL